MQGHTSENHSNPTCHIHGKQNCQDGHYHVFCVWAGLQATCKLIQVLHANERLAQMYKNGVLPAPNCPKTLVTLLSKHCWTKPAPGPGHSQEHQMSQCYRHALVMCTASCALAQCVYRACKLALMMRVPRSYCRATQHTCRLLHDAGRVPVRPATFSQYVPLSSTIAK